MRIDEFVLALANYRSPNVFNPYRDRCDGCDLPSAPAIRCGNLLSVLEASSGDGAKSIWIARDLGYLGGRRTGLPLTDEAHLDVATDFYRGASLRRATRGEMVSERTASIIWRMLIEVGAPIILWNVFPFHPHPEGNPLSNRCHTRAEAAATRPLIDSILKILNPDHVVAIGRDAEKALQYLEVPVHPVRHPSYGGQAEFFQGIKEIYGLPK